MVKPVSLLTLDEPSAVLGAAVQQRVAAACGLEDLVQIRAVAAQSDLAQTLAGIHARRQAPDSVLRTRDDIQARELVLLIASAASRATVVETATRIRELYDIRHFADYYSLEVLCLMPDLFASEAADYGAAYSLLKLLSAAGEGKPFDAVWLLDATNEQRVRFGRLDEALATYADAVAGSLL
ncbi:MAG TPA: hypothetical protein VF698_14050, partial [Thermoanaerobaculia bacterium]